MFSISTWPANRLSNFVIIGVLRISGDSRSGGGLGKRTGQRDQLRAETVVAHSARNVRAALAACEYSHCARSACQSVGMVVQLPVSWLAGNVQVKNTASVTAISAAATAAQ